MDNLKEIRISKGLTQEKASRILGISLRSYKSYENDASKSKTLKYRYMLDNLRSYVSIDEDHGILTMEEIKQACKSVLDEYPVNYCILFGSYSTGEATETSDVDLLISADLSGLRFFGMVERLREALHKNVDALHLNQLNGNFNLVDEILKSGVRIYEKC